MRLAPVTNGSLLLVKFSTTGHPAFNVDHVGVFRSKIGGTTLQQSIGQCELLQKIFNNADHLLVPCFAFSLVCFANDNLFNLFKLMDPVQTGSVPSRGTSFTPETSGDCRHFDGK